MKLLPSADTPPLLRAALCTRRYVAEQVHRAVADWHIVEGHGMTVTIDDETIHLRLSSVRGDGAYAVAYSDDRQEITVGWGLVTQPNVGQQSPSGWDGTVIPWARPLQTGDVPPIADVFVVLTYGRAPLPFDPDFLINPRYLDLAYLSVKDGRYRLDPLNPEYEWEPDQNPVHVATIYFPGSDRAAIDQRFSSHIHLAASGYPLLDAYDYVEG